MVGAQGAGAGLRFRACPLGTRRLMLRDSGLWCRASGPLISRPESNNNKRNYGGRKEAELFCGYFLRMGELSAYVGRNQNPKDLKGVGM